jgi:hypothetical protein
VLCRRLYPGCCQLLLMTPLHCCLAAQRRCCLCCEAHDHQAPALCWLHVHQHRPMQAPWEGVLALMPWLVHSCCCCCRCSAEQRLRLQTAGLLKACLRQNMPAHVRF